MVCENLIRTEGHVTQQDAMKLLQSVKLKQTVWSVVYNLSTGTVDIAMGKDYEEIHSFKLEMKERNE